MKITRSIAGITAAAAVMLAAACTPPPPAAVATLGSGSHSSSSPRALMTLEASSSSGAQSGPASLSPGSAQPDASSTTSGPSTIPAPDPGSMDSAPSTSNLNATLTAPPTPVGASGVVNTGPTDGRIAPQTYAQAAGAPYAPVTKTTVISQPLATDRRDAIQAAASFVTVWKTVYARDSLANNGATRAQSFVTPKLADLLLQQSVRTSLPSMGHIQIDIEGAVVLGVPAPNAASTVLAVGVTYGIVTVIPEANLARFTGLTVILTMNKQPNGTWLVSKAGDGAG